MMKHHEHQTDVIPRMEFLSHFPYDIHSEIRDGQHAMLTMLDNIQSGAILGAPTGTGKTAAEYTMLLAARDAHKGKGDYFLLVPNKAQVDQVKKMYPQFHAVYGRNEYDCLYYTEKYKADQVPCSLLKDCAHRVDQTTGDTNEKDVKRCPYLDAKYQAKQGNLIVCTISFYLFTKLFAREWDDVKAVVIDEAHEMPDIIRRSLSYEVTDWHLLQIEAFLKEHGIKESYIFRDFLNTMIKIVKSRKNKTNLLEDKELAELVKILSTIKPSSIEKQVAAVLKKKHPTDADSIEVIKKLEMITRDLYRYIKSFEFSLETEQRRPLNYVYSHIDNVSGNANYSLNICCYYVVPIVQKIFPKLVWPVSAMFEENANVFRIETGWREKGSLPFYSFKSGFSAEKRRIYRPIDMPNLSMNHLNKGTKGKVLKRIAETCKLFAKKGIRSLVLVVSESEREKFKAIAASLDLPIATYGDGILPKQSVALFKKGQGDALLGTTAQYGAGIDLPNGIAPVIFMLRPSYAPPNDPKALFEERRFGIGGKWGIWDGREMVKILNGSGRNVRSVDDYGVTFLISQQYQRIALRALPAWLQPAYQSSKKFDECVSDALKLLI